MNREDLSRKHKATLDKICHRPILGTIPWNDIEKLFKALGAEIEEREGSRIAVIFDGFAPHVFHRPHPEKVTDKGAVASVKAMLKNNFPNLI